MMKYLIKSSKMVIFVILLLPAISYGQTILFQEPFENTNYSSRGWYDGTGGALSTVERVAGSAASFECKILSGAQGCSGGNPGRHAFTATDEVYVSFYIKHSSNWNFSGHQFYILTTENGPFDGLAFTRLTAYIQEYNLAPNLELQDGQNIDQSKIRVNLAGVTENRAANGCNGIGDGPVAASAFWPRFQTTDGKPDADCWSDGSKRINGKYFGDKVYFQNTAGPYYKGDWHFIEAYFKLNSIVNGIGVPDGKLRYWYDGELIISYDDVLMRTGARPNMKFNQFIVGVFGNPASVTQTFWIDNLTVATSRPSTGAPPAPPQNLRVE